MPCARHLLTSVLVASDFFPKLGGRVDVRLWLGKIPQTRGSYLSSPTGCNRHCQQVPRARHLLTSVLVAMAPKLRCLSLARVAKPGCLSLIFQDFPSSAQVPRPSLSNVRLKNPHCQQVLRARHLDCSKQIIVHRCLARGICGQACSSPVLSLGCLSHGAYARAPKPTGLYLERIVNRCLARGTCGQLSFRMYVVCIR